MRRRLVVIVVAVICLGVSSLLTGCTFHDIWEDMEEIVDDLEKHGHCRYPFIDKSNITLFQIWSRFLFGLPHGEGVSHLQGLLLDKDGPASQPRAGWSVGMESPEERSFEFGAKDLGSWSNVESSPYFDRDLDGAWMVRSGVFYDGDYGELPFLVLANAGEGWGYLSVVFQNVPACAINGRPDWSYVYTGEVTYKPGSTEYRVENLTSEFLTAYFPNVPEFETSYKARPVGSRFFGEGKVSELKKKAIFTTREDLYRLGKPNQAFGLWSTGIEARVYAGEFLEPPIFNPVNLMVADVPDVPGTWRGGLYVLWGFQPISVMTIDGDDVSFEYHTANGPVDGELELANGVLKGRIFDPLTVEYKELTFKRAGSMPKKPKLKRMLPSTPPLDVAGREVTLQLKGKNLAPGSMVYFSSPDIRILSIQYLNRKKMKVKVEATRALARGTNVDVMVLSPDNRSAEKRGAIQIR